MSDRTLFVAGKECDASQQRSTFNVSNPASGETVWSFPSATEADCDAAVACAAAALGDWEAVTPGGKRAIFLKAAELVATPKYKDRIAECMSKETSAVPGWIMVNVMASVNLLRETAAQAGMLRGETIKSEKADCQLYLTQRRAAGVVFAIAPWNAPINLSLRAIAIPLACGNPVILKASEYSPMSQRIVVDLLLEAGLPPHVLSFLAFSRADAPKLTSRIIAHRAVRRVNFTGSDVVGRLIASQCGQHLKQGVFELGGKAPVIVLEDADLEVAARGIAFGSLMHSGQVCMSTERVLVQSNVHEELSKRIVEVVSKLRAGDATTSAQLSALFSAESAENVIAQLNDAVEKGAKTLLLSATVAEGSNKTVIQPQVVTGVKPGMGLWQRETFGPIIALTTFETVDEAVQLANDSDYSLIAGLWTRSLEHALAVAPRIRAGSVQVNGATIHVEPAFGNAGLGGASGYGRFNVDAFTDLRSIAFHAPKGKFPLVG